MFWPVYESQCAGLTECDEENVIERQFRMRRLPEESLPVSAGFTMSQLLRRPVEAL